MHAASSNFSRRSEGGKLRFAEAGRAACAVRMFASIAGCSLEALADLFIWKILKVAAMETGFSVWRTHFLWMGQAPSIRGTTQNSHQAELLIYRWRCKSAVTIQGVRRGEVAVFPFEVSGCKPIRAFGIAKW